MYLYVQNYLTSFYPTRHFNQTPLSFYKNREVDFYENDNFFQNAQSISLNEQQYRAFHWKPGSSALDVDWVRFTPTSNIAVKFQTIPVSGEFQPDTRITLFASDGTTQLFQNDNANGSTLFSEITTGTLSAFTDYYLRIENLSGYPSDGSKGQYKLDVAEPNFPVLNVSIIGPDYPLACDRGEWTASVSGGTGTYTYQWNVTENGVITSGGTSNFFAMYNDETYTRIFTLELTVTSGSQQQTVSKTISFQGCNSGSLYVVYPNPASESFSISPSEENKKLTSFKNLPEYGVKIYAESSSKVLWEGQSSSKETKVDSKKLANGKYLIQINEDKRSITKHVLIAH